MDISPAALPPRQPQVTDADRADPLFPEYARWRAAMATQLVEADSFADWKRHRAQEAYRDDAAEHPRYPEFLQWMRQTKAGGRPCPGGAFPANFNYWLAGGRW